MIRAGVCVCVGGVFIFVFVFGMQQSLALAGFKCLILLSVGMVGIYYHACFKNTL